MVSQAEAPTAPVDDPARHDIPYADLRAAQIAADRAIDACERGIS